MCCATHPPQVPNQRQMDVARSGDGSSVSMMPACLPSGLISRRSPGSAPGTVVPLAVSPCPCPSSAAIETSSSDSAIARADEKFPRPGAAEDRRWDEADHRPALRFDRRAHTVAGAHKRRFVLDPAFDEIHLADLELGLDQADEPRSLSGELQHVRKHQSLRNEAHVDDDRARLFAKRFSRQRARVEALERADARVRRKARIELSMTDIDGDDLRRAAR